MVIYAYQHHVRLLLPSLWSSNNQSLLGSRSRHCYVITGSKLCNAATQELASVSYNAETIYRNLNLVYLTRKAQ